MSNILAGIKGQAVYIDDILVYGRNQAEHDERLKQALRRFADANLKLNWSKCQIRKDKVKYLGHWLTGQGVLPDIDKLKAIQEMPYPRSLNDVRLFLGTATYMSKFIPNLSQITDPLRQLAKKDSLVIGPKLHEAFLIAKQGIAACLQKLDYFQPSGAIPTATSCDALPQGLGAMLWQRDRERQWAPVACASRSLTDVDTRYSQLEREMLGIVFATMRFRQYVLGRTFEVLRTTNR